MKEATPPPSPPPTVAMEEEVKEGQEEGKMEREEGSMEPEQSIPPGDHERQLSPGPSGPAAAVMASCHECGEEEPAANTVEGEATAAVAVVITVEVGVEEVEPHSVQLDYIQVCVCMTWHGLAWHGCMCGNNCICTFWLPSIQTDSYDGDELLL